MLDDKLDVVGRREARWRFRSRHMRGVPRGGRRENQRILHTAEPSVRQLPRCMQPLRPPAAEAGGDGCAAEAGGDGGGAAATDAGVNTETEWWARPWLHRIQLGGVELDVGLLLPARATLAFDVGNPDSGARPCVLTPLRQLSLERGERDVLTSWLVGSQELLRIVEPLHPSLQAPAQLMAFDRHTGDWTPQRREWVAAASDAAEAEAGPAPSAACDRWQAAIASGRMTAAELGLVIVETLFGHGAAAAPAIRT